MATNAPSVRQSAAPSVRVTDPWTAMRQEMNDLMTSFWRGNGNGGGVMSPTFSPEIDVAEKDNCFELRMDIPGMEAKDLDIQVQGNSITISGHRSEEKEEKGKTFHCVERRSGNFSRTVSLPCDVTAKEVAADYTNGVLNVVLPKCEGSRPAKIAVKG